MTYYLLFLICGFFAGAMFEKNRMLKMAIERFDTFKEILVSEAIKRKTAALLLQKRKKLVAGRIGSVLGLLGTMCAVFFVGCAIPMGSPIGYVPIGPREIPQTPVSFYMPPVAMDFTTGQWQAPDAFTEFKPRTPIPRQASGMIGDQYFTTLY